LWIGINFLKLISYYKDWALLSLRHYNSHVHYKSTLGLDKNRWQNITFSKMSFYLKYIVILACFGMHFRNPSSTKCRQAAVTTKSKCTLLWKQLLFNQSLFWDAKVEPKNGKWIFIYKTNVRSGDGEDYNATLQKLLNFLFLMDCRKTYLI
jgi:hypothetical protein